MVPTIEQVTMRKVYLRLLPLAMLVYFFCYLDRINVSFAALHDEHAISADRGGLWPELDGILSRLLPVRGAEQRHPRQGRCAHLDRAHHDHLGASPPAATAFVIGPNSFLIIRFLLGLAEAGLFPGIVLLFTYWFPDHHRGRIISSFTLALPVSVALGAPISTRSSDWTASLATPDGSGSSSWRPMPTVLIGIFVLFALTDKPAKAGWLSTRRRRTGWSARWRRSGARWNRRARYSLWQAMMNPKILLLSLNYLGIVTASLGLLLFMPQIIKSLGATNMGTGYATTLAYICGAISMLAWGWISDRMGERRWNLFWACTLVDVGLVMAGMTMGTWWSLAGMCIATAGFYGTKGPFWSMPSMMLTGTAAAAGIAWINSIGNVGGAVGPALVGWIKDFTGSYSGGLYGLAAFTGVSALIAAFALHIPRRVPVRGAVEVPAE